MSPHATVVLPAPELVPAIDDARDHAAAPTTIGGTATGQTGYGALGEAAPRGQRAIELVAQHEL